MGPHEPPSAYMPAPKNLKQIQKIKNRIRARGPPAAVAPAAVPPAGSNPIFDFLDLF